MKEKQIASVESELRRLATAQRRLRKVVTDIWPPDQEVTFARRGYIIVATVIYHLEDFNSLYARDKNGYPHRVAYEEIVSYHRKTSI